MCTFVKTESHFQSKTYHLLFLTMGGNFSYSSLFSILNIVIFNSLVTMKTYLCVLFHGFFLKFSFVDSYMRTIYHGLPSNISCVPLPHFKFTSFLLIITMTHMDTYMCIGKPVESIESCLYVYMFKARVCRIYQGAGPWGRNCQQLFIRGWGIVRFPSPTWLVNWCCHYSGLVQVTMGAPPLLNIENSTLQKLSLFSDSYKSTIFP